MTKEPVVVGIDLGGTNCRWALVNREGGILGRWETSTNTMPDQKALIAALAADLAGCQEEALSRHFQIHGVGFGLPGRVLSQ